MLLVAMLTTVAAVSLAMFSPIKAQRSLSLVMVLGIVLSWLVTRFLLEDFFLKRRDESFSEPMVLSHSLAWCWPVALVLLALLAVVAPSGVEVLDVNQFLPEDDPALDEMKILQSRYLLASSATTYVVINIDGDSTTDLDRVRNLQLQLGQHPSVISLDNGMLRSPMVRP